VLFRSGFLFLYAELLGSIHSAIWFYIQCYLFLHTAYFVSAHSVFCSYTECYLVLSTALAA